MTKECANEAGVPPPGSALADCCASEADCMMPDMSVNTGAQVHPRASRSRLVLAGYLRVLALMFRVLAIIAAVASSALATATVPADVETVVTGGYWESGGQRGRYRVVVVNEGNEHVHSRLFIEWVADPRAGQPARVVATSEPKLPFADAASFGVTLSPAGIGSARIVVSGVVSASPSTKVHAVVVAKEPGVAEVQ
jgi:hypothetical protein